MNITSAESLVMEVLWTAGPSDAEDVTKALAGEQGWTEATVRTLIGRLVHKKAVAKQKEGRRYLYRALIDRSVFVDTESQGLLNRLFDGRVGPFFAHFAEHRKLSKDDIDEIKALIERLDHDR